LGSWEGKRGSGRKSRRMKKERERERERERYVKCYSVLKRVMRERESDKLGNFPNPK
jgi:hypothetical protein